MYYFFTDETNKQISNEGEFFIFGGLIIPPDRIENLDLGVREIRLKYNYTNNDELKFSPHTRPNQISPEDFNKSKEAVLDLAVKNNCLFIVYVIHHKIIKNEIKNSAAVSHVIGRFNKFLEENKSKGLVFIDRMDNPKEQFLIISKLFTDGICVDDLNKDMKNILGYFISNSKSSNIVSVVDIVLGSFRYAVNNQTNKNVSVAKEMFKKNVDMMWGSKDGGKYYVIEKGLIFRPKKIKKKLYQDKYDSLLAQLNDFLS